MPLNKLSQEASAPERPVLYAHELHKKKYQRQFIL